jgi:tetratricopeptide (TPR) repeat protein
MKRSLVLLIFAFLAGALYAVGGDMGGGGGSPEADSALDWYNKGYAASQAERYREAVRSFRQAISLERDYAEAYNMLGFCLRKLGRIKAALSSYERALELRPDFPEAREYYGEAHLQDGNLEGALEQYRILEQAGSEEAQELLEKIEEYQSRQM